MKISRRDDLFSEPTQSPHFECRHITYVGLDFIRVSPSPSSVGLNTFAAVDRVATVLAELDVHLEVDDRGWKAKKWISFLVPENHVSNCKS